MNKQEKRSYIAFIWHGFFLALTMAMLDLNTVFPKLISTLSSSKYIFGGLYSILLGAPLIFNLIFSHFLKDKNYKKKYLLLGIYIRGFSFLGMAIFTYYFSISYPELTILSFFFFVFMFSVSAGFAGLSYSDLIAKTISKEKRTTLYTVKQFFGSSASLLGGLIIARIFSTGIDFPLNYSISLLIGFIGLIIASLGFYFIKEPSSKRENTITYPFLSFIRSIPSIIKNDPAFKYFIIVENLSSFSIMILPFYIIFSGEILNFPDSYLGVFLIVQISGTIFSNIIWGFVAKYFNAKTIVRFCIILGALNPIIAILTSLFAPSLYVIVFFILGFTISGRRIGFEPYLLDITPQSKRIEYLGIRGSLNIFKIVLPLLGAFFIESFGYYFAFIVVSIVMGIAVILMTFVKNTHIENYSA